jgi:hypothetical protein
MQRKALRTLGAFVLAGVVAVLAFSSLSTAAVNRIMGLIAPTSKSAVADVNAFSNWGPSTYSRDGFSQVTHPDTGIYCLFGRANPDKSMLVMTVDYQHSNTNVGFAEWDRSSPNCGPSGYEVLTFDGTGSASDNVAFFAQAYVR